MSSVSLSFRAGEGKFCPGFVSTFLRSWAWEYSTRYQKILAGLENAEDFGGKLLNCCWAPEENRVFGEICVDISEISGIQYLKIEPDIGFGKL